MSRPIPSRDYVDHFDPGLERHRGWLQAALERLVAHEPASLVEGGPLWRLWSTVPPEAAGAEAEALTGASDQLYPNPLVGMPLFQQRDSAQLSQRDRTCFSSSCAMLLEALKPGTLKGVNGDDAYLAVVQRYGDTTDANAQLQALAHYGVTARLVQTADFELIEEQIARGIPVPCSKIHRGPVDRPTGTGRWLIVIGNTPSYLVGNDPWGEPDLVSGATLNPNSKGLRLSRQNDRCAGLRLRQALDGGVDRRQCLPLCPGEGLGGGGGSSGLRSQRVIARFRLAHVADVDGCSRRKPASGWEQNCSIASACLSNRDAVAALLTLPRPIRRTWVECGNLSISSGSNRSERFSSSSNCGGLTHDGSNRSWAGDQAFFALRRKGQTCQHVLMGELGKGFQEFCFRAAGSQGAENIAHSQARAPDARLSKAHRWVNGDPLKHVHHCRLRGFSGGGPLVGQPQWGSTLRVLLRASPVWGLPDVRPPLGSAPFAAPLSAPSPWPCFLLLPRRSAGQSHRKVRSENQRRILPLRRGLPLLRTWIEQPYGEEEITLLEAEVIPAIQLESTERSLHPAADDHAALRQQLVGAG